MGVRKKLFGVLVLCGALIALSSLPSQAGVMLSAQHSVVSSQEVEGGFLVTVEVTLRNPGSTTLTGLTLEPIDPELLFNNSDQNILSVNILYANEEIILEWLVTTILPPGLVFDGPPLLLHGTATDQDGNSIDIALHSESVFVQ